MGGQKGKMGEWGKRCGGYMVWGPSCVLGCISAVVVEGACVRDCRRMGCELITGR
jgi:hypothetical protein